MENREILIANTNTQKRYKLTTAAETLGELKAAMSSADIDYSNLEFTEGISKTKLLDDSTQLPKNVMYKGQATNNLVILLTNTKKNIASGSEYTRQEVYNLIKEGNLQEGVKETFGRNFTQVPTDDLVTYVQKYNESVAAGEEEPESEEEPDTTEDETIPVNLSSVEGSLILLVDTLVKKQAIDKNGVMELVNALNHILTYWGENYKTSSESSKPVQTTDGNINDDDIDMMIEDLEF